MECAGCGHTNREGATFCGSCGQSLARNTTCPACSTENPIAQRFCDSCGHALGEAPATSTGASSGARTLASPSGVTPTAAPADAPKSFSGGRYVVRGFLGEGAKKRVYLASDTRLSRDVAVALIKDETLDEGGRERVQREAEAMGQLGDHPNVVTVYDIVEEGTQLFIVSQYMEAGDLERTLREVDGNRLPVADALRIADEIAQALQHAHDRGLIHRDVKPGNVWLGADGGVCLGDFGLALALGQARLTQHGMMVGTATYMAPEQALGRAPDARSDLYSLGATLYEMLTGRPPFVGDDPVAVISQHINTPPVAPSWHNSQISKPIESLIHDLLAKDPEARPKSAAQVRERLASLSSITASAPVAVAPGANPLDALDAGVFVGREREVAKLREGLDEALSGRGRILLLVGEPGIGKTRTSEELTTYASMRGAQVLWGRCYEGEGAPPYWPWVQIIRSYVRDCDPQNLAKDMGPAATDIAEIVSAVRSHLPGLPDAQPLDPEQARFRLFDGVTTFLRNATRRQPLVLVLDDLHWGDKASLLLLQFLARELGPERLLVLGTYRDVELRRQHPLADTLAELVPNPACDRILLRGLDESDVARFIERSSGKPAPPELTEAVFRETEGNPFFVNEVVRLLASDGRLTKPESGRSWSLEIPQGVREVIGRRLNRLSEDCNNTLTIGSVIGRDFDMAVLQRVSELPEDRLIDALDEAVSARVIGETPDNLGRFRFSHALVRETLYEELNTPKRVRLHAKVGEVLESLPGRGDGTHLAEISHHFFQAVQAGGGVDRAVAAATRAGDWAAGRHAHSEAAAHYEQAVQALELAEEVDRSKLATLATNLAELWMDAGDWKHGSDASLRAVDLAREIGDADLLARAVLAYGSAFPMIEMGRSDERMVGMLNEAIEAVGLEDSVPRAQLFDRLSSELYFSGDLVRIQAAKDEAIAIARRLDDPDALATALAWFNKIRLTWTPAELEAEIANHNEVIALSKRSGNLRLEHRGMVNRTASDLALGRREALDRDRGLLDDLADAIRTPYTRYFQKMYTAMVAYLEGRFDDGDRISQEAHTLGERAFPQNALQWFACQQHAPLTFRGRIVPTGLVADWAERFPAYPVYSLSLARIQASSGEIEPARRTFDRYARDGFDLLQDGNYHNCLHLAAETCVDLKDRDNAAVLYEKLLPCDGVNAFFGPGIAMVGPLSGQLGALAMLLENYDVAQTHYEQTLARMESLHAWPWVAQCQFELAEVLLARGESGDRERALELLNAALERAQSIGMEPLLQKALAKKLEAQGADSGAFSQHRSIDIVAHRTQQKRPDLSTTVAPDGTVTLMFSDMEGFTMMTERLGDLRAREVIRDHNRIVREQLAAHGGYEVELQGDGFLLAFGSARRALLCAIGIQRAMAEHSAANPKEPIRVRIGLHTGEALREADKFFGRTVILAARIAAQAQAGEILASALLCELTRSSGDIRFGADRVLELKGIAEKQRVHSVDWE